jgi:hypothetical protein
LCLLNAQYVMSDAPKPGLFGMGGARYPTVDLNTSSLKMYWNVARQFGGQVDGQIGGRASGHWEHVGW